MDQACRTNVPMLALSIDTQVLLSTMLNPTKIIPTETNLPRDWRGVAELANVPAAKVRQLESHPDPFRDLLTFLSGQTGMKLHIDDLKAFLGVIDRFDILEDATPCFDRDILTYAKKISEVQLDRNVEIVKDGDQDSANLTFEDAYRTQHSLPLTRYDAFILYSDDDSEFASEIIQRMEGDCNLKLCSKDRDLLPGLRFEHEVIGKMIENRCNRLLVVFSPSFLKSNANQFLVSYAQAVALDTRSRKIIPCVYKKCDLPPSVRYSFCIDYTRSGKLWNFWDKLGQSLMNAPNSLPSKSATMEASKDDKSSIRSLPITQDINDTDWWDPKKTSDLPVSSLTIVSSSSSRTSEFDEYSDIVSVHSQAHLLPSKSPAEGTKPSKWLRKIMNPMKGKKSREKEKNKQDAIADM